MTSTPDTSCSARAAPSLLQKFPPAQPTYHPSQPSQLHCGPNKAGALKQHAGNWTQAARDRLLSKRKTNLCRALAKACQLHYCCGCRQCCCYRQSCRRSPAACLANGPSSQMLYSTEGSPDAPAAGCTCRSCRGQGGAVRAKPATQAMCPGLHHLARCNGNASRSK
jgi:hypothetical protein